MELFRATTTEPFNGPHQQMPLVETGAPFEEAKIAIIMIHGRGASAESILGIANEIEAREKIVFLAPKAQNHTWYPYSFLSPLEQNQPHLNSAIQSIYNAIQHAVNNGIAHHRIILLGFSQGACLASEFAARHPAKYAGVVALSGGVIGSSFQPELYAGDLDNTPYFIGCSDVDPHIPEQRVHESASLLKRLNAQVTKRIYPELGHTINSDEIHHINTMVEMAIK